MALQIREVQLLSDKKELKAFINLPWSLYSEDKNWVPPLKLAIKELFSPKHPFYKKAEIKSWIASQNGQDVGRIVAIVNHAFNEYHQKKTGFFGFFESAQEKEVSEALFNQAENYLKSKGMTEIQGPVSPSTNYECGMLIEGFEDPPQIMMTYNPSSYPKMLDSLGYKKAIDLLAYQVKNVLDYKMPSLIERIAARASKSGRLSYRPVNKKRWAQEVDLMLEIYNSAWQKNWGFVPMSEEEFRLTASELKNVVDENMVIFAEVDGKTAGFLVALPDYNQVFKNIPTGKLLPTGIFKLLFPKKYISRFRIITMGVKEEYRKLGLETLLYQEIHRNVVSKRPGLCHECEMSWILEHNKEMNKPLIIMGAKPYKKYRIYEKSLI